VQQQFRYLQQRFGPSGSTRRTSSTQQWVGPTLNPTSTQFGRVTTVALNQLRFFSFGIPGRFYIGVMHLARRQRR
jgi:hypothetical protein